MSQVFVDSKHTVQKVIQISEFNMKCRGKLDTTRNIPCSISISPLHFVIYLGKSITFGTVSRRKRGKVVVQGSIGPTTATATTCRTPTGAWPTADISGSQAKSRGHVVGGGGGRGKSAKSDEISCTLRHENVRKKKRHVRFDNKINDQWMGNNCFLCYRFDVRQ